MNGEKTERSNKQILQKSSFLTCVSRTAASTCNMEVTTSETIRITMGICINLQNLAGTEQYSQALSTCSFDNKVVSKFPWVAAFKSLTLPCTSKSISYSKWLLGTVRMVVSVRNPPQIQELCSLDLPIDVCAPVPLPWSEVKSNPEILRLHSVSGRARPKATRSIMNTGAKLYHRF
jgi:hypothetical protein